MSGSNSEKSSILKFVPETDIELGEFLQDKVKDPSKHTILINGRKADLKHVVKKDDEVIVLPILRGG